VLLQVPVCALSLVEGGRASGTVVLAAQPGRAGHVVVGHRGWLHRLQGLVGRVATVNQSATRMLLGVRLKGENLHLLILNPAPIYNPSLT